VICPPHLKRGKMVLMTRVWWMRLAKTISNIIKGKGCANLKAVTPEGCFFKKVPKLFFLKINLTPLQRSLKMTNCLGLQIVKKIT
jgi:hypothetical protein